MIYQFKKINILFIAALLFRCSNSSKEISIKPLELLNYRDSLAAKDSLLYYKTDYFLVSNFKYSTEVNDRIEDFVNSHKDSSLFKYTDYKIIFYKESSKTNIKNITKNPRIVDRYSNQNDLIYQFWWSNGKFLVRYKYKNGKIIEPIKKNIIDIKDIPKN